MTDLPKFSELPIIEKTGERHDWGIFGKDDQIGMINLLTPERVKYAASLVRKGIVFNIDPPSNTPHPGHSKDEPYIHHMTVGKGGRTDYADHWMLHSAPGHLDGLRHMRYREFGYYQGLQDEDLDKNVMIGIERWAQHGIVGRGVFIDVVHYLEKQGQKLDPQKRFAIKPELIESVARDENVTFLPADIMLLRTGWMEWYLGLSREQQASTDGRLHNREGGLENPGLDATQTTVGWLWDHQIPMVWADNIAVEALRVEGQDFMHRRMLPLLGMSMGELFNFKELSQDCAHDGVYECMVSAHPVGVPGAVGSPANAYVIK